MQDIQTEITEIYNFVPLLFNFNPFILEVNCMPTDVMIYCHINSNHFNKIFIFLSI